MRKFGRLLAAAAVVGVGYLTYLYLTLPDVRALRTQNPDTTAFIELRTAEARAAGRNPKRDQRWVAYERISPNLKRAVLVAEDAAFWDHEGIDLTELRKSLEMDLERGELVRGGSTITQQLAKNLYLSPSRNPLRKLREFFIARRLEAELSKRRIFELYLNEIEWGDGIYGVEAAARAYFQAPASAIDPDQAALLAGAIVNPRALSPLRPNGRLRARQRLIRARMGRVEPPPSLAVLPAPDASVDAAAAPSAPVSEEPAGELPQAPVESDVSPEPAPVPVPKPFPGL